MVCIRYGDPSSSNKIANKGLFEAAFSGTKTGTGVQSTMKISSMKNSELKTLAIDSTCSNKTGQCGEEKEGREEKRGKKGRGRGKGREN